MGRSRPVPAGWLQAVRPRRVRGRAAAAVVAGGGTVPAAGMARRATAVPAAGGAGGGARPGLLLPGQRVRVAMVRGRRVRARGRRPGLVGAAVPADPAR